MSKATTKVPTRAEANPKYQWDLSQIFTSDQEWEKAYTQLKEEIPEIKQYQGKVVESAFALRECLQAQDSISERMGKVYVYAHLKKDEDTGNAHYAGLEDRAMTLVVQLKNATSFIVPEILAADEQVVRNYIQEDSELAVYEHALDEILRQKAHILSAEEEAIIAQAGDVTSAPGDIFTMINNADMTFPDITDENGEPQPLTHGRYIQFMENKNRRVRQDAFEAMYGAFKKQKNTLAATLSAAVKKNIFYSRVRRYNSALESALEKDNIPVSVYSNLVDTVREHLPLFHRYMSLRKKCLEVEQLHLYDVYVPLTKDTDMKYEYEEAQALVRESLHPLGNEYQEVLQKGFSGGWIDVYENQGKRSGAYSSGTYGTPPYILMNYQNTLDNVFTLTHELGHSLHSYFSNQHQPYVYASYSIFVAEVASTVNEALLTHHLLQTVDDPKKRMYILNHYLDGFRGVVFRQTMFAEFERLIHEKVEQGEPLTHETLSNMYYDLNVDYFGPDVVVDRDIAMEWARIPHFYYNFYVYKYATGFSAAAALSKQILEEGEAAITRYLDFLKSGGSDYPIEVLKKAGVDMTTAEPVRQALHVFEQTLDEFEQLVTENG